MRNISIISLLALFALSSNMLIISSQFSKKFVSEIKSATEAEQSEEDNSKESESDNFEEDFALSASQKAKDDNCGIQTSSGNPLYFYIHSPTGFHNLSIYSPPEYFLV